MQHTYAMQNLIDNISYPFIYGIELPAWSVWVLAGSVTLLIMALSLVKHELEAK
jgi:hypothetical protein